MNDPLMLKTARSCIVILASIKFDFQLNTFTIKNARSVPRTFALTIRLLLKVELQILTEMPVFSFSEQRAKH